MAIYLVDFENIGYNGLKGIEKLPEGDQVHLFYSSNADKLTFDIHYQIRLVDSSEYDVANFTALKGFISGLHAGNYDITHIFIDSLTKIVPSDGYNETEDFLKWLNNFGEAHDIKFTITISDEPDLAPEGIKQYF